MTATAPGPRQCGKREGWTGPPRHGLPILVLGTVVLIAFGGGTHPLTLGLLTVSLGLGMVARPPEGGIGGLAGFCWIALFTWILLAVSLPATAVDWRLASDSLGIPIASTVTPQPWVTIEAVIPFLAGSAFLLLALAHKPDFGQRRHATHLLAFALSVLGAIAIIAASFGWRLPWADEVHVFSWFPNRNQTALTFACGSVLLFGLAYVTWYRHSLARKSASRVRTAPPIAVYTSSSLALFSGCMLLYATFQSLSRGALIAWCCGMLTLIILRAASASRDSPRLLRFVPAFALLLFSFFVFLGGDSRDRMMKTIALHKSDASHDLISSDFRWEIYADTVSMIADQPVTGVGLGQFHYIFPQYRSIPAPPVAILHPESDWLWWLAELGVVGLALIVLGVGSLLFRLRRPKAEHPGGLHPDNAAIDRLYRHIACAALVPIFVHSLVDVGAHRLGTVALGVILYVLALPQTPEVHLPRLFTRKLGRGSGVAMCLIGSCLIALAALRSPLLSTYAPTASKPLASVPLQWQPYFRSALLTYPFDPQRALQRFYQARFLMADNAAIPFQEGLFLLEMNDHGGAFAAFHSAIRRSRAPAELFEQILRRTVSQASHQSRLYRLAQTDDALLAAYWSAVPGRMLKDGARIDQLTADWPSLPVSAQQSILRNLHRQNVIDPLLQLFESSQPEKQSKIWPVAMQALVTEDRWQEALALFDQWSTQKPLPGKALSNESLRQLQARAVLNADDPAIIGRLIHAYLSRRMWEEVRRTAERARALPGSPPDTVYWLGLALAKTGHEKEAARAYAEWLSEGSK